MDSRNTHIPPPWCILTHMHTCPHLNLTLPTNLISGMPHKEPSSDTRAQCDSCAPPSSRSSPSNSWGTQSGFSSPHAASLKVAPRRRMERWRTLPIQFITLQTCSGSVCEGLAHVYPLLKRNMQQKHESLIKSMRKCEHVPPALGADSSVCSHASKSP